MNEKQILSLAFGIMGLCLIAVSAGPLAAVGLLLCMLSHHAECHYKPRG